MLTKETDAKYLDIITKIGDFEGAVSLQIKATKSIKDKFDNVLLNNVINPH